MIRECESHVAADLRRFYQVRLSDMWLGYEDAREIAAYVQHMPRGGALGAWLGGQMAVSDETDMLRLVEHAIWASQAEHPNKVKLRDYPEGEAERQRKLEIFRRNARRYKRRRRQRWADSRSNAPNSDSPR